MLAAGLLFVGGGCARHATRAPTSVYVDANRLARLHPEWSLVEDLDRRIAWLSHYTVEPAAAPRSAGLPEAPPRAATAALDLSRLTRRLESTLDELRSRETISLERELERERRQARLGETQAERRRIEDEATRRFQAVLDRRGEQLANLDVRLTAVSALERSYATRGAAWEGLAGQMRDRRAAITAEIGEVKALRTREVDDVFTWLKGAFAEAAAREDEDALEWIRANRDRFDELTRAFDERRLLLMEALRASVPPAIPAPTVPPAPWPRAATVPAPPVPGLQPEIAALRQRRERLARLLVQNTMAAIKSAARSMDPPLEPAFEREARRLEDHTAFFAPVAAAPTRSIVGTETGDLSAEAHREKTDGSQPVRHR